jgi:hypothetical protein
LSKFNTPHARPAVTAPITSEPTPSTVTHEGGAGYGRDTKSELFLLAVTNMVSEDTFYETAGRRDARYEDLVARATLEDPEWTARLLGWLRGEGNLRSAALVGAAVFVKTRLEAGLRGMSRQVVNSVLQRADEPGEMLAYWRSRYSHMVPQPVKRGIADAARRLYTERAVLKYDTNSKGFRFGDVLELVHARPKVNLDHLADRDDLTVAEVEERAEQLRERLGALFSYVLDRRHRRDNPVPEPLTMLREHARLMDIPQGERAKMLRAWGTAAATYLRDAGMTWESLAGWLNGPMDAVAWEAIIPSMGYMALLRNVRNFDQAGVSDTYAKIVAEKLADPEEVARSKQFPFRFLAAYQTTPSLRWGWPLEQALNHSLANVPELPGRTLILVDRSRSMWCKLSARSELLRSDAAALFGTALAMRAQGADLVQYGTHSAPVPFQRGESVLPIVKTRFTDMGGTNTWGAVRQQYRGHDRVVIVTDEQAHDDYGREFHPGGMGRQVPIYVWDLAGYRPGSVPSGAGTRDRNHVFGGLTDQAFRLIPLLEAGRDAGWPF